MKVQALWGVAGLAALGMTAWAVRIVPRRERLAVFRLGRLVAVRGAGLALVIPVVERTVRVPAERWIVDALWVRAVTEDGVPVTVNAAALAEVTDPAAYARRAEPADAATARAIEAEIVARVGARQLAELATWPVRAGFGEGTPDRELTAAITARTRAWGVDIAGVQVSRVDVPLTTDLIELIGEAR